MNISTSKIFFLFFMFVNITANAQSLQKFINVTGNSEIIKKADQLKFSVQINTVDESVEASKILNDKYLVDLLIILRAVNIPSGDTEISPLAFGKNYEYTDRERVQKGYYTKITVSFLLKDLKRYYEITNKLTANDAFEINAVYEISDYELQHRTAYENAIVAAKGKAEYMAAALNLSVGEVIEIEELNYAESFGSPFNTVSRETAGGNIAGNVSIKRSVRVKFEIMGVAE